MTAGEQLAFAQTSSPSAPTSLHGTPSFTKRPPKSAVHTLHPCRKVFEMGPVFYFIDLESHRIINCEKQRRGRKALLCVSPSSRAVSRFSRLFCFTELPMESVKEAKRTDWIHFLRAERCGPCDFGGIRWNFLREWKNVVKRCEGIV